MPKNIKLDIDYLEQSTDKIIKKFNSKPHVLDLKPVLRLHFNEKIINKFNISKVYV